MHRVAYALIFAVLLGEALLLSPPQRPDQSAWILRLVVGDWSGEEPSVVALFQLMGVWPMAMVGLLAGRLRRSPVPLWPFCVGSMALGGFVLLPGLLLGGEAKAPARWQGWLGGRGLALGLSVAALGLVSWAVMAGSPGAFVEVWRTEQFVHVMAHDFVALWLTSVVVAHEQGERRWWWTAVPLFGVLAIRLAEPLDVAEA